MAELGLKVALNRAGIMPDSHILSAVLYVSHGPLAHLARLSRLHREGEMVRLPAKTKEQKMDMGP